MPDNDVVPPLSTVIQFTKKNPKVSTGTICATLCVYIRSNLSPPRTTGTNCLPLETDVNIIS